MSETVPLERYHAARRRENQLRAERDAALAAVTAARAILSDVLDLNRRVERALAALGTVGQPQEDPSE